jgi:peptidoglycan/xylan/chitin deacetylase (PgdA/CDA1 family)
MSIIEKIQTRIRITGNYAGNDLKGMLGMNDSFFRQARGHRILVYHGICLADPTRFNSLFITQKTFEEHLRLFKKYFNVISLDDFYNGRFSNDRFNISITFDDGFANNYKYALPLLEKYQLPASFFVTAIREAGYDILWNDSLALAQKYGPGEWHFEGQRYYRDKLNRYVGERTGKALRDVLQVASFEKKLAMMRQLAICPITKQQQSDYWLQMEEDEIRHLAASPLVTVGCHGYFHNDLAALSTPDLRNELSKAKQFIERATQKSINSIAFPYGSYSSETIAEAKQAGFTRLLAADFLSQKDHADMTMRERLTVNPYISVNNQIIAIINGKYPR